MAHTLEINTYKKLKYINKKHLVMKYILNSLHNI